MAEMTREQEGKVASLAIEHGSVRVEHQPDGAVKIDVGGRVVRLDADGNEAPVLVDHAYVRIPVGLLERMLGADVVGPAVVEASRTTYAEHRLDQVLGDDVRARIAELLATSETLRSVYAGVGDDDDPA